MSDLYNVCKSKISELSDEYRAALTGGLSVKEAARLVAQFLAKVHQIIHEIPGTTSAEQDAAIIIAVREFYADVIRPLNVPGLPEAWETILDQAGSDGLGLFVANCLHFYRAITR